MLFNFYNGFSTSLFKEHLYLGKVTSQMDISNSIFDEIDVFDALDIDNSSEKANGWTDDTYMQALFQNNLEGGSLVNQNIPIQKVRFKRKTKGSLTWETLGEVDFNKDIQNYNLEDYFIKNTETYTYSVVSISQSTEGKGMEKTIQAKYDSLFITDSSTNCAFRFDFELGDINYNTNKTFKETLNSRFPATIYSNTKYRTGSFKATIVSSETEANITSVNVEAENVNRETVFSVLTKESAFLLRHNDVFLLCELSNPVQGTLDNSITGIVTVNVEFTEIGETDVASLQKFGLKHYIRLKA